MLQSPRLKSNRFCSVPGETHRSSRDVRFIQGGFSAWTQNRHCSKCSTYISLAARLPGRIALLAERKHYEILWTAHEVFHIWRRSGCDYIKLFCNLTAICGEWEVIDVFSERVFDLAADGEQADNYIGRNCKDIISDTI